MSATPHLPRCEVWLHAGGMSEILDSARAGPSFASAGLRAEARRGLLFLAVGSLGLAADATVLSLLQALGAGRPAARAASDRKSVV